MRKCTYLISFSVLYSAEFHGLAGVYVAYDLALILHCCRTGNTGVKSTKDVNNIIKIHMQNLGIMGPQKSPNELNGKT